MNRRFATTSSNGRDDRKRLVQWLVLVGVLVVIGYASRIASGKPDPQILYRWSTAKGGLLQDAIVLAVVLAIAGFSKRLLALRRPVSWGRAAAIVAAVVVGIYLFEGLYTFAVHPGNEQGLTPKHWEPAHAAAYVVNGIVICTWVPFVEELTYRGLGYSLLEPFGRWPAIAATGLLFGLAHGLVLTLPVVAVFGSVLAWVRAETRSVFPGMAAHATFNLIALILAVTVAR